MKLLNYKYGGWSIAVLAGIVTLKNLKRSDYQHFRSDNFDKLSEDSNILGFIFFPSFFL